MIRCWMIITLEVLAINKLREDHLGLTWQGRSRRDEACSQTGSTRTNRCIRAYCPRQWAVLRLNSRAPIEIRTSNRPCPRFTQLWTQTWKAASSVRQSWQGSASTQIRSAVSYKHNSNNKTALSCWWNAPRTHRQCKELRSWAAPPTSGVTISHCIKNKRWH